MVRVVGALLVCALVGCQAVPPAQNGLTKVQIAALEETGFRQTDDGWELGFNDRVLFETDKAEIKGSAKAAIARIGKTLMAVNISHARIYGYTDSTGSDEYNERLSKRRADAVSESLIEAGMPQAGVGTFGRGKGNPVADNATAEGRAQNRRVAIVISTP